MNVKAIFEVSSHWISGPQEKTEECDLKKMKTKGEMRSLLNAPQDPVKVGAWVRLT